MLLHFSSQYSPDSEDSEKTKKKREKHSEQAEALLKMSCTIDTLSSMYYAPNDDDT